MRLRRLRAQPEIHEQLVERPVFIDPFPDGAVDIRSLLVSMGCTMRVGILKTAIVKVVEGTKPSMAREIIINILSQRDNKDEENPNIHDFAESLISSEVTAIGRQDIDRYSDGTDGLVDNLKFFPYQRDGELTLKQALDNVDLRSKAIKQSLEVINQFVYESYTKASTDEFCEDLFTQFENWQRK